MTIAVDLGRKATKQENMMMMMMVANTSYHTFWTGIKKDVDQILLMFLHCSHIKKSFFHVKTY